MREREREREQVRARDRCGRETDREREREREREKQYAFIKAPWLGLRYLPCLLDRAAAGVAFLLCGNG